MKTPVITRQGLGLVVGMVAAIALTAAALISFSAGWLTGSSRVY
jgi:hypothetical protein